jgi:hypothetical protein
VYRLLMRSDVVAPKRAAATLSLDDGGALETKCAH